MQSPHNMIRELASSRAAYPARPGDANRSVMASKKDFSKGTRREDVVVDPHSPR